MIALDASALLGYMLGEPGCDAVGAELPAACMSAVNLTEVLARFARDGHDPRVADDQIRRTGIEIVAFEREAAVACAELAPQTRALGLSLGDRACLAQARSRGVPAMTADRSWAELSIGVAVRTLR